VEEEVTRVALDCSERRVSGCSFSLNVVFAKFQLNVVFVPANAWNLIILTENNFISLTENILFLDSFPGMTHTVFSPAEYTVHSYTIFLIWSLAVHSQYFKK
jgi:hypothetical protein